MTMRRKMEMASTLAMLGALAPGFPLGLSKQVHEATDEENKFLETLGREGQRIWGRRIARGLSESEKQFIRDVMAKKMDSEAKESV